MIPFYAKIVKKLSFSFIVSLKSHLNGFNLVNDAPLLDSLDESVSRPVVRNCQPQRLFRLRHFHFLLRSCWSKNNNSTRLN
jgi:hypothetical protein